MAKVNHEGNIVAKCPGCNGSRSTYEWRSGTSGQFGSIIIDTKDRYRNDISIHFRLFKCAGCGRGGLGVIQTDRSTYPSDRKVLVEFYPEVKDRLTLPISTPDDISSEYDEAQRCYENNCYRAAAGLFRSVLEKTLKANGYKLRSMRTLEAKIDAAANDGVITRSRQRRAHEEIRVLGNDVLHDDWREISAEDVEASRHYCQRILEDFYDDREEVEKLLKEAGRITEGGEPEALDSQ